MNQKSTDLMVAPAGTLAPHHRPGPSHRAQATRRARAQHPGPTSGAPIRPNFRGPIQAPRSGPSAGTIPWPGPHAPP